VRVIDHSPLHAFVEGPGVVLVTETEEGALASLATHPRPLPEVREGRRAG